MIKESELPCRLMEQGAAKTDRLVLRGADNSRLPLQQELDLGVLAPGKSALSGKKANEPDASEKSPSKVHLGPGPGGREERSARRAILFKTSRERRSIEIPVSRWQLPAPAPYFSVMLSAKLMTQIVRKILCGPTEMPATR